MQPTLSLAMIVRNEALRLPDVLQHASVYADEIVIVDTGSTDSTKKIAKQYTPHVYEAPWEYDFAKARNVAIRKCTKDYIIWLDADDIITEKDAKKIKPLLVAKKADVYVFSYDHFTLGAHIEKTVHLRPRIFKNEKRFYFMYPNHDVLHIPSHAKVINVNIPVYHKKTLAEIEESKKRNKKLWQHILKKKTPMDSRMWCMYGIDISYDQPQKAIAAFTKALTKSDNSIDAHQKAQAYYWLSQQYIFLEKYEKAMQALQSAIKTFSSWREPYFLLGVVYLYKKDYLQARKYFLSCLIIAEPLTQVLEKDIYDNKTIKVWIARTYYRERNYLSAFQWWIKSKLF